MKDWTIIVLGVVSAVAAALIVDWIDRTFKGSTSNAGQSAWNKATGTGVQEGLPNLNLSPESPAYSYPHGAPVTNWRPYQRVGVMEVAAE